MKKSIIRTVIVLLISAFAAAMLGGCGSGAPDPTKKYVVFSNSYGDEEYTLRYPGRYTVEYDYFEGNEFEDARMYYFYYSAYYSDNDEMTGENGRGFSIIRSDDVGKHYVVAKISHGGKSYREYTLEVIIKEKPDLRVTPEVRFDPNGATLEERDGETVYVFKESVMDEYYHQNHVFQFPILELYDNDIKIDIPISNRYIKKSIDLETGFRSEFPGGIGLYRVYYEFYDYKDKDKEKYYAVEVDILIEIQ